MRPSDQEMNQVGSLVADSSSTHTSGRFCVLLNHLHAVAAKCYLHPGLAIEFQTNLLTCNLKFRRREFPLPYDDICNLESSQFYLLFVTIGAP
eukprot:3090877-Amphidinium_carterae.1